MDDPEPSECPECKSVDFVRAQDALFNMAHICPKCDNTVSYFGMSEHGDVCLVCEAEEKGRDTKHGNIQCKGSKEYCIPEFIDTKTGKCYGFLRDEKIKREAKKASKKNAKGKGKGKGKRKRGKGKYPKKTLDDWI